MKQFWDRAHRCVDGRVMRHDQQPDDPYLETDTGRCENCDGAGCFECSVCGHMKPSVTASNEPPFCSDCQSERRVVDAPVSSDSRAHDIYWDALDKIAQAHLGDCPEAQDELSAAKAHIQHIRRLASDALKAAMAITRS